MTGLRYVVLVVALMATWLLVPAGSQMVLSPPVSGSGVVGVTTTGCVAYTDGLCTTALGFVDDGNSGTADTIDWATGPQHLSTLTGNVTYTFSNPVDGGRYQIVINTGAGGFTVTWPAAVEWPSDTAPTISTAADKVDICTFTYLAAQSAFYGACAQAFPET